MVIAIGLDPLKILILSQVVLSFTLPFALVPLLLLTNRESVMRSFVSVRLTRVAGLVRGRDHPDPKCRAAGAACTRVIDLFPHEGSPPHGIDL